MGTAWLLGLHIIVSGSVILFPVVAGEALQPGITGFAMMAHSPLPCKTPLITSMMAKPGEEDVTVSKETQYYCPWILSWFTQRQLTESHKQQISNVKHLFEAV